MCAQMSAKLAPSVARLYASPGKIRLVQSCSGMDGQNRQGFRSYYSHVTSNPFQTEVASSLQDCVCLASPLGLFESAKLEHAPWIVLRCDGPPAGTMSEEPLEV